MTFTKEQVRERIMTVDGALYGGIMELYKRQTESEKSSGSTHITNGVGFNKFDANFMTSLVQAYRKYGSLTFNQKRAARKVIQKYIGQLTKIANGEL